MSGRFYLSAGCNATKLQGLAGVRDGARLLLPF